MDIFVKSLRYIIFAPVAIAVGFILERLFFLWSMSAIYGTGQPSYGFYAFPTAIVAALFGSTVIILLAAKIAPANKHYAIIIAGSIHLALLLAAFSVGIHIQEGVMYFIVLAAKVIGTFLTAAAFFVNFNNDGTSK
jgi:hypothetical protein